MIMIYTVIPYWSNGEVFINDVKSFTSFAKAEYYLHELNRQFVFSHIDITESELELN